MNLRLSFLVAFIFIVGCNSKALDRWEPYSEKKAEEALGVSKPVVLYFYAAWCPTCYQLRDKTFGNPEVARVLEPFARFKADLSFRHSTEVRKMTREFGVRGVPTVIFFDSVGEEITRFAGGLSAGEFLRFFNEQVVPYAVKREDIPLPTDRRVDGRQGLG